MRRPSRGGSVRSKAGPSPPIGRGFSTEATGASPPTFDVSDSNVAADSSRWNIRSDENPFTVVELRSRAENLYRHSVYYYRAYDGRREGHPNRLRESVGSPDISNSHVVCVIPRRRPGQNVVRPATFLRGTEPESGQQASVRRRRGRNPTPGESRRPVRDCAARRSSPPRGSLICKRPHRGATRACLEGRPPPR